MAGGGSQRVSIRGVANFVQVVGNGEMKTRKAGQAIDGAGRVRVG